jgi:membrane fusion protein (multidrug efflux system)
MSHGEVQSYMREPVNLPASLGPLGIGACFAVLVGCAGKSAPPPPPPPEVSVTSVKQEDIPIYGDWVATLDGFVNANIQSQVSGYLIRQTYREGSFVHKGDVLFEIDPRPFDAALAQAKGQVAQARGQLAQAQAQLALTQINVKRDTPLAAARAIAQSQLDNDTQGLAQNEAAIKSAEGTIQAAEAGVATAELNLGFTKVRSLVDGIAGLATTQIGNLVNTSTALTTVSQVDPIKVYFPISEQEYLRLAARAQPEDKSFNAVSLQLTLANGQIYAHPGHIIFTDRQVDRQTGTIRVVGAFSNPGNLLRPGQFARVRAETDLKHDALLVPQRAVSELQGRYQVAVVNPDHKISIKTVKVSDRVGSDWIIDSGLQPGEQVVSEGVSKVRDGSQVNPKPDSMQSEPASK